MACGRIGVIDTETNWYDRVMSLGAVIADGSTLRPLEYKYYIFSPEYTVGGMYSHSLALPDGYRTGVCRRAEGLADLARWLDGRGAGRLFAYNARFDRGHLPELGGFEWYDIIKVAAYRQYNAKIPPDADCCSTGRLRRSFGVEPMLRLLSGDPCYRETHNALIDALDELRLMRLLGVSPDGYRHARIN